jgi:processive 1,2-diacylglycerol beta-glucosyltransferase
MLYRSQYNKSLNRVAQLALHRIFYAQTLNVIEQLRPDIVVSTHPFPSAVVSRLKRSGVDVPLCTVITDYDAHGSWINSGTNLYLVSTADLRDKLIAKGVAPQLIEVTGIPVHPSFWHKHEKDKIRAELGFSNLPTVLIMGGGWGIVNRIDVLENTIKWRDHLQFIVCLGDNDKAREELLEKPEFRHPNIHLIGFTDQVHKLMDASDLLITKPGGMTCTEAMAKRIPMLIFEAIPGPEEENMQYFINNGFAETIDGMETIDRWFHMLVHDQTAFEQKKQVIERNMTGYRPQLCVERIMQFLEEAVESNRSWANA